MLLLLLLLNVRTVLRYQRGKSQAVIGRRKYITIVKRKRTKGQTIIYKKQLRHRQP